MSRDLITRARALVERKSQGDISPELFGDQAQCLLAPMATEIAALKARLALAEAVAEASLAIRSKYPGGKMLWFREFEDFEKALRPWLDAKEET